MTAAFGLLLIGGALIVAASARDRGTGSLEVTDIPNDIASLEGRWTPFAYSAVTLGSDRTYLEFQSDGTLDGYDGCNNFGAQWEVNGDRLYVSELAGDGEACPTQRGGNLVNILHDDPTIGTFNDEPRTLKLESESGFVAFEQAEPGDGNGPIETEVSAEVTSGGAVTVTFRTPSMIATGNERELARWTSTNTSDHLVTVWEGFAIAGLPDECGLQDIPRWDDLAAEIAAGRPPTYPAYNIEPGLISGVTASRKDVPVGCKGDYVLVLLAISDSFQDEVALKRVPITIR